MPRILVMGGNGSLGREFARAAAAAGYAIRVGSRRPRPECAPAHLEWAQANLATGAGLEEALAGVDIVLHAATNVPSSATVDVEGTRRLLERARAARVSHFLYPSIVGIEKIPFRYYRSKLAAEVLLQQSGMPLTILRTTQFHSLIDRFLTGLARLPWLLIPSDFYFQSVAESEVTLRLLEYVARGPAGRTPDFGGPEVRRLGDMTDQWLRARSIRHRIVRLPLPGKVAEGFRRGENTLRGGDAGKVTWLEWLSTKYPTTPSSNRTPMTLALSI